MSVYTPHFAPIVVMAFLGTASVLALCVLVALAGVLQKSKRIAIAGTAFAIVVALVYGSILLGLSLFSHDVELPKGAWKYFCEIDCHIAYSVGRVEVASPSVNELEPASAAGKIVIVELRTWFDPTTISPHRGNGPLMPSERSLRLIDNAGHQFTESTQSRMIPNAPTLHSTPLRTPLRPGESSVSYLVFEAPDDRHDLRLLVTSVEELDAALWGHEISPFHGKAYFDLHGASASIVQVWH